MANTTAIELMLSQATYQALQRAAQRSHKSETEVALEAIESYLKSLSAIDPLLGLFANEPEVIERAAEEALTSRETTPFRLNASSNE